MLFYHYSRKKLKYGDILLKQKHGRAFEPYACVVPTERDAEQWAQLLGGNAGYIHLVYVPDDKNVIYSKGPLFQFDKCDVLYNAHPLARRPMLVMAGFVERKDIVFLCNEAEICVFDNTYVIKVVKKYKGEGLM